MISGLINRGLSLLNLQVVHKSSLDWLSAQLQTNITLLKAEEERFKTLLKAEEERFKAEKEKNQQLSALISETQLYEKGGNLDQAHSELLKAAARGKNGYCYLGNYIGVARTHLGHYIYIYTRDREITPHIVLFGEWERSIEDVVAKFCKPGATVVEVGANIGYHTLAMANAIGPKGRLHTFEANPEICTLLHRTVRFNSFLDRVTVHPEAVLDREREIEFFYKRAEIGGGHLGMSWEKAGGDVIKVKVDAVSLDKALDIGNVDVLRIDAEGTEPLVLQGARQILARSPKIKVVMEWDYTLVKAHKLDMGAFLEESARERFRFWKIEPDRSLTEVPIAAMANLVHHDVVMARHDVNEELR